MRLTHCKCRRASHRLLTELLLVTSIVMASLTGCGGSSDSGANDSSTTSPPPSQSNDPPSNQPTTGGPPSNNHPASGFYDASIAITVAGGRPNFNARLRIVVDPGGGVAVEENSILRAQARMNGNRFEASSGPKNETLFGMTCSATRRYVARVADVNARIRGSYQGEFSCSDGSVFELRSTIDLPRTGDHQ